MHYCSSSCRNAGNKTKFRKVFEIGNVVNPSVPDHDLENEYLVEISSDVYGVICKQMLDSIQGIMEVEYIRRRASEQSETEI